MQQAIAKDGKTITGSWLCHCIISAISNDDVATAPVYFPPPPLSVETSKLVLNDRVDPSAVARAWSYKLMPSTRSCEGTPGGPED